jgi:hypothetical protein
MPMQSESLEWRPLIYTTMRGLRRQCRILAIRADGKGYFGLVNEVTPEFVELSNGNQKQIVRFFDSPTQFAIIDGPRKRRPVLAESQLFGKDKG